MQAAAKHRWGSDDLSEKSSLFRDAGHVGYFLCKELHQVGASSS